MMNSVKKNLLLGLVIVHRKGDFIPGKAPAGEKAAPPAKK